MTLPLFSSHPVRTFRVDTRKRGAEVQRMANTINIWNYATEWLERAEKEDTSYFRNRLPFVKYVQLMTAAGGSESRDLFASPLLREVTDDYRFDPLIRACRNILRQGLIPQLKLGNIPLKITDKPLISSAFGVNVRPPADLHQWHRYISAMAKTLVDTFGLESVQQWRFGVLTEYENKDWFSLDDSPEATRDAFFALYDFTVDALEMSIGKKVCVGAHSMTVSEGLWDEREFIDHCARGKNFCTGKTGTHLDYLAASYYDLRPGIASKISLDQTIDHLRNRAEKMGLKGLFYGIDEGRILQGLDKKDLVPRAIGNSWQAAYDARMFISMHRNQIDYFSQWMFTSAGIWEGVPSVSQQVALLVSKMAGAISLSTTVPMVSEGVETGALAAYRPNDKKLFLLLYAYSDSVYQSGNYRIQSLLQGLPKRITEAKSVRTLVSDDSNFFDEWEADRLQWGVSEKEFGWSSGSYVISPPTLNNPVYLDAFRNRLPFYQSCALLRPEMQNFAVENGTLTLSCSLPLHGVVLYEFDLQ